MKTWKLVSGILSMILFVIVTFQSCAAGVANSLEANGETSGSAGVFVAILMLAGGIVSVATRNSEKKGGNIALIVLFGLAALVGFIGFGINNFYLMSFFYVTFLNFHNTLPPTPNRGRRQIFFILLYYLVSYNNLQPFE